MVAVTGRLARPIGYGSFADLTPVEPTSITAGPDGSTVVEFPDAPEGEPPTVDAETLARIKRRMESRSDIDEQLRADVAATLAANAAFLAVPTPTAAQVRTQTQSLTRQLQVLIRFALDSYDGGA